jgi:hypothetical protein
VSVSCSRQVLRRVQIVEAGDANYIAGEQVERSELLDERSRHCRWQDPRQRVGQKGEAGFPTTAIFTGIPAQAGIQFYSRHR